MDGPTPNSMQGELRKVLTNAGFVKIGTAAYEGHFPTSTDAMDALADCIDFLDNLPPMFEVDHLWIYLDRN